MGTLKHDLLALGMELRETHISEVFLAPDTAYKLKKPVQLGFLDFSTLALRKHYCELELELNRRLAANVYRRVVPVVRDAQGVHRLGGAGAGEVVDYAVEMRRLPDAHAADKRLQRGQLTELDLTRIAEHLANFHAKARCDADTERYGSCEAITANVAENFEQTRATAQQFIGAEQVSAIEHWQRAFLQREHALFEARISSGRIRDGHGDLRLEHCYLDRDGRHDQVEIIDCIEFNDRFRYADVAADVAFLAMDLAFQGRRELGEVFLAAYARAADDCDLYGVVDFYQSYRAYVRGKVSSMLALDASAEPAAREPARELARKYYQLAYACTQQNLPQPTLYAIGGVIAAGKSSVANEFARQLHAPIADADQLRKRTAGADPQTPWHDPAFSGRYAPAQTDAVYAELLRRAAVVLRSGRSMVLDASFRQRSQRAAAQTLARELGCEFRFIECVAPPEVCRARLEKRAQGPSASDGRLEIFDDFVRSYEAVTELPETQHVRFDTCLPATQTEARVRALLGQ